MNNNNKSTFLIYICILNIFINMFVKLVMINFKLKTLNVQLKPNVLQMTIKLVLKIKKMFVKLLMMNSKLKMLNVQLKPNAP